MNSLTIVAKFKAKSSSETAFYQELLKLIAPTLAETGCLNYDLHRSIEDNALFLFYENWSSRLNWEHHMESEHLKAFQKNTAGMIDNSELLLMRLEKVA